MSRRHLGGIAAAALVGAAMAALPHGAVAAAPAHSPSARSLAARSARALVASHAPALKVSAHEAFQAHPVLSSHGIQYAPYERTYRGLPVVGGDFVVVTDSHGQIIDTSVAQTHKVRLHSLTPKVTKSTAVRKAGRRVPNLTHHTRPQLVVWQHDAKSRLGWETRVTGHQGVEPSIKDVVVDARNGKVLQARERVSDGTGTSAYEGPNPVTIPTTHSGSTYSMTDPNHPSIKCQDASTNTTLTGTDDVWGNGNATNKETACVDAMYVENVENTMLSAWDGRNGFDGNGGGWPIRIGLDDENAYYDGTQVQIGHNEAGDWIPVLDVLGHEQGHGVDDHTPGGLSGNGTQEFVADTFGAATEWYANEPAPYDTPDFTVGEEVNLVGSGPIRYMYNPSLAGDDNCYSSAIPNEEVHAAAGPGNHWFYLLAEGTNPSNGQPTSPTCNSTSITGVGIQKAEQIMYNAMLMKTSNASYLKYRTWTLTAAKNLDPTCALYNTTKAAWNAVSVPAQSGDPTCTGGGGTNTVTVANPGSQTGTVGTAKSLQLTGSDSASGQSFTWSASGLPGGLSINASTGLVSGTPTTAGTFSSTVTAKDTTGATGSATFTWTISGGGGGGSCSGQKLVNPGFESGNTGWTITSGVIDNTTGEPARSGSWKAWLDGYGTTHTDTLSQSVAVPAGCHATLTYYLHIDTQESGSTAYDKLTLTANGTTKSSFSNANHNTGYAVRTVDLSSYAGSTVTIKWTGTEDSSLATNFVIDDTSLNLS
ncbi:MAG TPA: M4 family metallopeptidase [Nocardioides sp.]|jgi:Zn-dependent metalloprotease|uniref:M4 family metallopeptidase n=1 Tax=Nocardioides sp. TaxID=35761 RepID=UPI002E332BC5|nr:M4 family metallopeptidase [Nocardioides sp.]HEX3932172.1 M4 family metallopeptidase [Nocardioides sp.]